MDDNWVLDATMGYPFCFCPIEGDPHGEFTIVTGINYIGAKPPGKLVGIIHQDGQEAVEAFYNEYKNEIDAINQEGLDE